MSTALILACLWVLASTITALLPYRMQFPPGIALLVLSLPMAAYVGYTHGWVLTALVLAAIVSMFRNPLRYFWRKARGEVH